jgi:hypothetical protein
MKDKFDEMLEELDLESFGNDFDAKPAKYQVYALGYNKDEAITDYEAFVKEFDKAEDAVEYAKNFVDEKRYETLAPFPAEVAYLEILVETVVDFEDHTENVGTLFSATVKIN